MSLSRLTETSSAQPLHSGYLTKEPMHGHLLSRAQRRFFVLTANKLEWFVDEASVNAPKGELLLVGSRYERRARKELMVSCGDDTLVLKDDDEAALDTWEAALSRLLFDVNEPITPRTPRESRGYVGDDDQFASFSGLSVTASVDFACLFQFWRQRAAARRRARHSSSRTFPSRARRKAAPRRVLP